MLQCQTVLSQPSPQEVGALQSQILAPSQAVSSTKGGSATSGLHSPALEGDGTGLVPRVAQAPVQMLSMEEQSVPWSFLRKGSGYTGYIYLDILC